MPAIRTLIELDLGDNQITATLQPFIDGEPNFVSSENGFITLTFKPGTGFSKWGGIINFKAPSWFTSSPLSD
jgi:hypothetical protein